MAFPSSLHSLRVLLLPPGDHALCALTAAWRVSLLSREAEEEGAVMLFSLLSSRRAPHLVPGKRLRQDRERC